ncbi:hypothetical protein A3K73_04085 [Candidatus Pacearchaeota archaeon RBG_13_36_9]|nr:MAG: hypothetical protein A3K73_04085 [Candidatus Pacearchaeota archaeon RBG_13_36_9]
MSSLDFEILFIEDDEDFVDSINANLTKFLNNLGFIPRVTILRGGDFKAASISETTDLILIDLNLSDNIVGSDLIKDIRECKNVSDIIFYSDALADFDNALKSLGHLEGVYFCRGRKDLLPKIEALIIKSIKRQQEVSNLRGLVISEAIDLEAKMSKIIVKFFGLINHPREGLFYEKILDPEVFMLGKKSDLMGTICKELKSELTLKVMGAKKGEKEEEKKLLEGINKIHDECKNIHSEIVEIRDILSHVKQSDENPKVLKSIIPKYKEVIIDDSWCINARKNLIKHSKNLDDLSKNIF